MEIKKGQYCYSTNGGEVFWGNFETLRDLALELKADSNVIVGQYTHQTAWSDPTENIVEQLSLQLYDEVGEAAEDHEPDESIVKKHVQAMLKELPAPNVWHVEICNKSIQSMFSQLQAELSDNRR